LSFQSRPDVIYQIVDIFKQVTGTKVELSFSNLPLSFDETLNRSLYRIVQESLTNAIRHGKATEVRLQFWIHEETLKISIHDNGIGAQEITKGIGLTGMEERMSELGGSIKAGNAAEGGFTLNLSIPLVHYGSTYRAQGKRELISEPSTNSIDQPIVSNHITSGIDSQKVEHL
jgi:glucose-6-phosphate-specific signal transduction histidine kinase